MRCISLQEGRKIKGDSSDHSNYIWLAVAAGVIVAFGAAWRANSAAAAVVAAPTSYLAPAALDSLGRYLRPVALTAARRPAESAELFAREDYLAQPAGAEREDRGPVTPAAPGARWVVSAILLMDAQRMAVVNDSVVVVGSTLPGGARVVEIESDRVVLQESGGSRRVISLNR